MESNHRTERARQRLESFEARRVADVGTSTTDMECAAVEALIDSGEILAAHLVLEIWEGFLNEAGE